MAKKAVPSDPNGPSKRGRHVRTVKMEGVMLHVRAIIEQGRTEEFMKAC